MRLRSVNCVPSQMQCNYIFQFSRSNIKSNAFSPLLGLRRQHEARYTPHLKLNTEHVMRFALC
jgi:hypothetical protein